MLLGQLRGYHRNLKSAWHTNHDERIDPRCGQRALRCLQHRIHKALIVTRGNNGEVAAHGLCISRLSYPA